LTAIGIYALQRIVVPKQEKGAPPEEGGGRPGTGDEL
jgi:hypothetical protein